MPRKKRRSKRRKKKRHIILILFLIIIGIFFFIEESDREGIPKRFFDIFKPGEKPKITIPGIPPREALPKVSIVIDDLGPNKNAAEAVLKIKYPLTLSVLPQEVYSAWIAGKGHRLGLDIIAHIPMEATKPLKLGKGGLYTWMTDREIVETLDKNISSIPYIKGISSHMGSAFTQDERAMHVLIWELKKHRLFFLDSRTTPKSVGLKFAKAQGLNALRRDIFLDDDNNPDEIKSQWKKLIKIAREKDYAIAVAHPRKNTIKFLQKTLKNNNQVKIVPLSELFGE